MISARQFKLSPNIGLFALPLLTAGGGCLGALSVYAEEVEAFDEEEIRLLTDLIACYEAADITPPAALKVMRELLVPPLLALRHGDGMLGSWQGQGAISADRINAVIEASGVRTRPLSVVQGMNNAVNAHISIQLGLGGVSTSHTAAV